MRLVDECWSIGNLHSVWPRRNIRCPHDWQSLSLPRLATVMSHQQSGVGGTWCGQPTQRESYEDKSPEGMYDSAALFLNGCRPAPVEATVISGVKDIQLRSAAMIHQHPAVLRVDEVQADSPWLSVHPERVDRAATLPTLSSIGRAEHEQ